MGQDEVTSSGNLRSKSCEDMTVDDIEAREQFIESTRTPQNISISDMDIPYIEEGGDPRNEHLYGKYIFIIIAHIILTNLCSQ